MFGYFLNVFWLCIHYDNGYGWVLFAKIFLSNSITVVYDTWAFGVIMHVELYVLCPGLCIHDYQPPGRYPWHVNRLICKQWPCADSAVYRLTVRRCLRSKLCWSRWATVDAMP